MPNLCWLRPVDTQAITGRHIFFRAIPRFVMCSRTLIGAVGISEKQEPDVSPGSLPEINRSTDGVGENKSWFRQGRRADLPVRSIQRVPPCMSVYCRKVKREDTAFRKRHFFPHPA